MTHEFARNIIDASLNPATFALPTTIAAAGAKGSAGIDLGADVFKNSSYEFELSVPALTDTMAPAGSTAGVRYEIHNSDSSTFNGFDIIKSETFVGTGSGVVAKTVRARIPSNAKRYVRGYVLLGTTATDASTLAGTFRILF